MITDKSVHTVLDAYGLNITGEDETTKYLGFLATDRMSTIYFERDSFMKLRKDANVEIESFYGFRTWLQSMKADDTAFEDFMEEVMHLTEEMEADEKFDYDQYYMDIMQPSPLDTKIEQEYDNLYMDYDVEYDEAFDDSMLNTEPL
jgi:hypothetical protein